MVGYSSLLSQNRSRLQAGAACGGSRVVLTLTVEDVDVACAELTALAAKSAQRTYGSTLGIRTASVIDPNGYIWEIPLWLIAFWSYPPIERNSAAVST